MTNSKQWLWIRCKLVSHGHSACLHSCHPLVEKDWLLEPNYSMTTLITLTTLTTLSLHLFTNLNSTCCQDSVACHGSAEASTQRQRQGSIRHVKAHLNWCVLRDLASRCPCVEIEIIRWGNVIKIKGSEQHIPPSAGCPSTNEEPGIPFGDVHQI